MRGDSIWSGSKRGLYRQSAYFLVAELTPEFFASDGSFLQLPDFLDLGVRANGRRVADVALPPWAFGASDFVQRCREALESDIVSAQLHHWVDLIFGFKNRGPAAEASDNLFYFLTYDNAVNIEAVSDPERRAALQAQVAEFGQTPRQLFTHGHPSRGSGAPLLHGPGPAGGSEDVVDESGVLADVAVSTSEVEDGAVLPKLALTSPVKQQPHLTVDVFGAPPS